jgi:hypothetical protein
MKAKNIMNWLLRILLWVPLLFFSLLLAHNAMLYFTHGGEYGILPEKLIARQDLLWNICFYIHLPAGVVCLMAPFVLFARRFLKKALQLHVFIGKIYVWTALILVCPTGLYLALYAKGGFVTQVGFVVQAVLMAVSSWMGYRAILTADKVAHVNFMIRSYAVATVVLTFRILHILFFLLRVPYQENYAISQWLGLCGNLLLAEICIAMISLNSHNVQLKSQRL